MKEEKTKGKKRFLYYCILTISVLLLAAAIILTVYFVSGQGDEVLEDPGQTEEPEKPDDKDPDEPTGGDNVDTNPYVAPVSLAKYNMEYGEIYTNNTIGWIYRHYALDFHADAGADVFSMAEGTVKEVSYNTHTGNRITVEHADGLVSSYTFVEPVAGLGVGQKVAKGEKIGTVATAYGSEYKDGTHLHFEVKEGNVPVNPTKYIKDALLEEK